MQAREGILQLGSAGLGALLVAAQDAVLLVGLPVALLGIDCAAGSARWVRVLSEFLTSVELGPRPVFRVFRAATRAEVIPGHHLGLSRGLAVAFRGAQGLLLVLAVLRGGRVLRRVARGRCSEPILGRHQGLLLGRTLALV